MVGGSTLFSSSPTTASVAFQPPAEDGGVYPSASLQVFPKSKKYGFSGEFSYRYKEGLYNGFQKFRPLLYDVNAIYAPHLTDDARADLMAGIGGQTALFYNTFNNCNNNTGVCPISVNSTHFAVHLGAGVRYYFWRSFFARPEIHYYRIIDNSQFHSDNVFRAGVSIGYTFRPRPPKSK